LGAIESRKDVSIWIAIWYLLTFVSGATAPRGGSLGT
jgi:hypothetical protein